MQKIFMVLVTVEQLIKLNDINMSVFRQGSTYGLHQLAYGPIVTLAVGNRCYGNDFGALNYSTKRPGPGCSKLTTSLLGATKSDRDLPLYEIVVLLKIGGTGSCYACLLHHLNILIQR